MKKIIGIMLVFIMFFLNFINVSAGTCDLLNDGYSSDSDIGATARLDGDYDASVTGQENGVYSQNFCGPYFSNKNDDIIFIKMTDSPGTMYRINPAVFDEDSDIDYNEYIEKGFAKYEPPSKNNVSCPSYIKQTNEEVYLEAGNLGITGKNVNKYVNSLENEADYYYQKDIVTCIYFLGNHDKNFCDKVEKGDTSMGLVDFSISYFKKDRDYLRVYIQGDNWILKGSKELLNIENGKCPDVYVGKDQFGYKYATFNKPEDYDDEKCGYKYPYTNHMDYKYRAFYLFDIDKFESDFQKCYNEVDEITRANCYSSTNQKFSDGLKYFSEFCNDVYSKCNYNDSATTLCLDIDDRVSQIMEKYNLKGEKCGLSSRLIFWFANIIRWIKYIAPVLAIILGMLDFIKAIISSNDDDMKKSQGKFVKRLIAAALLFIVPFIIEFVLDKFNIVSDYCNLI